jgi:hypothetical protein
MQTDAIKDRFRSERLGLGLAAERDGDGMAVGLGGQRVSQSQIEEDIRVFDEGIRMGEELDMRTAKEGESDANAEVLDGEVPAEKELTFEERVKRSKKVLS